MYANPILVANYPRGRMQPIFDLPLPTFLYNKCLVFWFVKGYFVMGSRYLKWVGNWHGWSAECSFRSSDFDDQSFWKPLNLIFSNYRSLFHQNVVRNFFHRIPILKVFRHPPEPKSYFWGKFWIDFLWSQE